MHAWVRLTFGRGLATRDGGGQLGLQLGDGVAPEADALQDK